MYSGGNVINDRDSQLRAIQASLTQKRALLGSKLADLRKSAADNDLLTPVVQQYEAKRRHAALDRDKHKIILQYLLATIDANSPEAKIDRVDLEMALDELTGAAAAE